MNKQCVNCPGATDHSTAECPVVREQSKIDAERAAFEAWYAEYVCVTAERVKSWREGDSYSEFYVGALNAWLGWQARASLPVGVPAITPAMIEAGANQVVAPIATAGKKAEAVFRAMLAAAPTVKESLSVAPTVKAEQVPEDRAALVAELRKSAGEIASAGHFGWGNAMTAAADALDAPSLPAAGSAGEEVEVVAWVTPEKDRAITALTEAAAREDGGAMLSSVRPYSVPCMTIAQCLRMLDQQRAARYAQQSAPERVSVPSHASRWPLETGVEAQQRAADAGCSRVACLHDALQAMLAELASHGRGEA